MAKTYHAGIIPGAEAKKLYSYPTLSASSDTFLMGSGQWASTDDITVGTARQAVRLSNRPYIDGISFDGYQKMSDRLLLCLLDDGDAQIKTATTTQKDIVYEKGLWFILYLGKDNTATSPKLQINSDTAYKIGYSEFITEENCRRLVKGYYIIAFTNAQAWSIVSGPPGFYPTATQSEHGLMSKTDKQAHDTMVAALSNPCTTEIDSNGCLVVKLYGSNTPFLTIDKAGEW